MLPLFIGKRVCSGFSQPKPGQVIAKPAASKNYVFSNCAFFKLDLVLEHQLTFIFLLSVAVAKVSKVKLCFQLHMYSSTEFICPPPNNTGKNSAGVGEMA